MKTVCRFSFFCILISCTIHVYSDDSSEGKKLTIETPFEDSTIIFIPDQNKKISFLTVNELQWHDNGMIKSGVLEEATQLIFTSNKDKLWFKAETNVIFDGSGLVESGTLVDGRDIESNEVILLKKDTLFKIPGGKEIEFKGNSIILKNKNDEAIYGTLTEDKEFYNIASGSDIGFKKGYPLLIDSEGNIREGVLLENTEFMMILHKRFIWIKKGSSVLLDQKGRIRSGTLLERTYLKNNGGTEIAYRANTVIVFNEEGYAL